MIYQAKQWVILDDKEYNQVWDKLYSKFHFSPSINPQDTSFVFTIPVSVYDISQSPIWNDNEELNTLIRTGFIKSMANDSYMYALDWQHTCFRYNPRIEEDIEYPVFVADDRYSFGGYNVYFPSFYPNGDYCFFIGNNFSWGYLTHPWQKRVYIFGEHLMNYFANNSRTLAFDKIN